MYTFVVKGLIWHPCEQNFHQQLIFLDSMAVTHKEAMMKLGLQDRCMLELLSHM
jgi:hypothetical protein